MDSGPCEGGLGEIPTEGTVEDLAQAAIALDDEINGTRKKKEKKGRRGVVLLPALIRKVMGRIGNVRRLEIVLKTGEMNAVIVGAGTQTTTGKWSSRQWKKDDPSSFNPRNVRSESRAFDDMDKPMQVKVKDNMRMVRLGGKWYNWRGFRVLCVTGNRCFHVWSKTPSR